MDNHIFRSAIGGFNRHDVMEYIERVQRQAEETARNMEAEANELRRELSEVRAELDGRTAELDERTQERDDLSKQLEDMTVSRNHARNNWDAQSQAKEAFRRDLTERDAAIREMTGEKQRLQRQVEEMEGQMEDLRRQKEQLAQIELDARQRVSQMISAAEAQARDIVAQAQAQAEQLQLKSKAETEIMLAEAEDRSASLRQETRELLSQATAQYDGFFQAFQAAAGRVASEIQKLDAAAKLPEGFTKITERIAALREKIEED